MIAPVKERSGLEWALETRENGSRLLCARDLRAVHSQSNGSPDPGPLSLYHVQSLIPHSPAPQFPRLCRRDHKQSQKDRPRASRYAEPTSSSLSPRGPMTLREGGDEEFEFLLNFLASDGVNPDPDPDPSRGTAAGSRKGGEDDRSLGIQTGSDGKLDLGQVKAFYEGKNVREGKGVEKGMGRGRMTDGPGFTDHSRNHSGLFIDLHMLRRTSSSLLYSVRVCHSTPPVAPDDM